MAQEINDGGLYLTLASGFEKRLISKQATLDSCGVMAVKKTRLPNLNAQRKGTGVLVSEDKIITAFHTQNNNHRNFIGFGAKCHSDIYDEVKVLAKRELSDKVSFLGEDTIECEILNKVDINKVKPLPFLSPDLIDHVVEVNLYGYGKLNRKTRDLELHKLEVDLARFRITYKEVVKLGKPTSVPVYGSGAIDDGYSGGPVVATVRGELYLAGIQIKEKPLVTTNSNIMGKVIILIK
jgi:hypothetical protein